MTWKTQIGDQRNSPAKSLRPSWNIKNKWWTHSFYQNTKYGVLYSYFLELPTSLNNRAARIALDIHIFFFFDGLRPIGVSFLFAKGNDKV